jgi:hypothetical protein
MVVVARYPDATKTSLEQRLNARVRERWPQINRLRPLPQRPDRLDLTPDELTGQTT